MTESHLIHHTILIVEDDDGMAAVLEYNLQKHGYDVQRAGDGRSAIDTARQTQPDLILLDLMLSGIDGIEVCRQLRREMTAPIVVVTARAEELDRVVALEVGADDYVTKPFSMRELLARVKAQLRRTRLIYNSLNASLPAPVAHPLKFGNLVIDLNRCEVLLDGKRLSLKPKEYELLASLAQNPGQVFSRVQLLSVIWGQNHDADSRTVDVHIYWLRRKIEPNPAQPQRLVTVRGLGYRFDG